LEFNAANSEAMQLEAWVATVAVARTARSKILASTTCQDSNNPSDLSHPIEVYKKKDESKSNVEML
jgi:hypothetical protein